MLLKFPVVTELKRICSKFYNKLPLATILFTSFTLQICGAVGLVGFVSFRNGQETIREFASHLENEVCDHVEQYLDRYLKLPQQINQINLDAIQLGLLDVADLKTTGHYFWKQMQVFDVGYISFSNSKWEFVGVERLERDKFIIQQTFASVSKTRFFKQVTYITDRHENCVKLPATVKVNSLTKEVLYANSVKAGKSVWSKNYQWKNKPVLSISNNYPVYDSNSKLIGVLEANINFSQIDKFLGQLKLARSGVIIILEWNGLIVASSGESYPMIENQPKYFSTFNSKDSLIQQTKQYLIQQYSSFNFFIEQKKLISSSKQANCYVYVKPWYSEIGLDLLIVVVIPENEFTEKIQANIRTTDLVCIVSFLIFTLFSIFTTRWIFNQILLLNKSTKKLAEGKWNENVKINGFKELAEVAKSVNGMVKQLHKYFTKLRAKNTELKVLNKVFSKSESRLTQFLEAIPMGVIIVEASGKISYINEVVKQIFGQSVVYAATIEEIIQVHQVYLARTDQLYPSDRLPVLRAMHGENVTVDYMEIRYSDKIICLEASGKVIYDKFGKIIFAIATFVDISQRKQTQKLLAEYNPTLKTPIKKRTSELLQIIKQLQTSQKELIKSQEIAKQGQKVAEQANQAKSQFLANMSHELRTPLNAILGFTQMMSYDKTLTVENQQNLAIVNSAGEHLLHVINDILEISKIEAGKTTLNLSSFDLILLLENLKQTLGLRATAKGLKLVFEYAPNLPRYIKTDSHKLRQVLLNLLGNAIKFTDIGSVKLRVTIGTRDKKEDKGRSQCGGEAVLGRETLPQERLLKVNFSRHQGASASGKQCLPKRSLSGDFLHTLQESTQSASTQNLSQSPVVASAVGYPKGSRYASSADLKQLALTNVDTQGSQYVESIAAKRNPAAVLVHQCTGSSVIPSGVEKRQEAADQSSLFPYYCYPIPDPQCLIPDTQFLIFEVTDTGSGISPEEIHLLFKPFGQTENGRKAQQGTGLGLAISQNYVQLMGGNLDVSSTVDVGSKFTFDIQINLSDCSEISTKKFQHQNTGLAHSQGKYRILIVDDHLESRLFLMKLLSSIGFTVKEATNGGDAISVWESWQPHLILMDMRMPVMDGYEAIRIIRARETKRWGHQELGTPRAGENPFASRSRTIMIALSANVFEEEHQKILSTDCDDFIGKPFSIEVLLEKLSKYLGVQYTDKFTNQKTEAIANQMQPTLTYAEVASQLLQFSPQWIAQIHHAAASCSDELILDLLKQVPQDKAPLVQILSDLANNYQFEKIMELTRANAE
ncbi:ATP-binding protein [Chlorogloeopsis sp. ULAP01]|uniref:ATP-binding protein n=1 Tax=Chlorogloeopsis sp. ULAP01 TaxID=3056483 RepID=UPI0025AB58A2|nr:ATP-binding protein [Chlorogloeopsis sp. ULAP01]MDM9383032.1 ATP-binding protein [Chlorogloeopsis sp. ULAP01]